MSDALVHDDMLDHKSLRNAQHARHLRAPDLPMDPHNLHHAAAAISHDR